MKIFKDRDYEIRVTFSYDIDDFLNRYRGTIENMLNCQGFEEERKFWVLVCDGIEAKRKIKFLEKMKKKFDLDYSIHEVDW